MQKKKIQNKKTWKRWEMEIIALVRMFAKGTQGSTLKSNNTLNWNVYMSECSSVYYLVKKRKILLAL